MNHRSIHLYNPRNHENLSLSLSNEHIPRLDPTGHPKFLEVKLTSSLRHKLHVSFASGPVVSHNYHALHRSLHLFPHHRISPGSAPCNRRSAASEKEEKEKTRE